MNEFQFDSSYRRLDEMHMGDQKHINLVLPEQNDTVVYVTSKTDNTLEREQLHLHHVVPERQIAARKIQTSLRQTYGFPCL